MERGSTQEFRQASSGFTYSILPWLNRFRAGVQASKKEVMILPQFSVKAETTENLSVGAACFVPDIGQEPRRCPRRIRPTRILNERPLAAGRLSIFGPLSRRLASWIVLVDFERSGFNLQVDP
jgi:hypothetical protein